MHIPVGFDHICFDKEFICPTRQHRYVAQQNYTNQTSLQRIRSTTYMKRVRPQHPSSARWEIEKRDPTIHGPLTKYYRARSTIGTSIHKKSRENADSLDVTKFFRSLLYPLLTLSNPIIAYKYNSMRKRVKLSASDGAEEDGAWYDSSSTSSDCSLGSEAPTCLTRELKTLPMGKQEQVGQDLYGIADIPTITADCLEQFEVEIQKLANKPAYDRAMEMSPSYVTNETFRVMFLRAVEGNPKRAAKRITKHFSTKLELFGEDKLVKDIEISDLDEHDLEALESGGFQVLPKDNAGRSILFGRYTSMRYKDIKNMVRLVLLRVEVEVRCMSFLR